MPRLVKRPTDLAAEIARLHGEIEDAMRTTLDKAIRIGELLTEQKDRLQHGEFGAWVANKLPFTDRTARSYMRLYRNRDRLKTESISDLATAYRLLTEPKPIQQAKQRRTRRRADDPPAEVTLNFPKAQRREWDRLVRFLLEKVFRTDTLEATILAALRFAKEHADA